MAGRKSPQLEQLEGGDCCDAPPDHSLEKTDLDHFVVGNKRLPVVIGFWPDFGVVEPPKLFRHLVNDPSADTEAIRDYTGLPRGFK